MRVEWQRDDPQPADEQGADRATLERLLRDEIAANGPVTFARFMERALYEPDLGYYARDAERPTRTGDFVTAPELHPVFGHTFAVQIDEMWRLMGRPADFALREFGAGSGALFLALLDGLVRIDSQLAATVSYQPIDLAAQRALIGERLATAGAGDRLSTADGPLTGVLIANEFLDALPVHRVIRLNGRLREIHVDWRDGRFVEVAGPTTDGRLDDWFRADGIELQENQRAEVNLAMLDWVTQLERDLERGYAIVIDYGAGAADLYGPDRPTGTIRAFSGQRVSGDVLTDPGSRDITSHVDFDALERQARDCGLEVCGRRRSAEFLLACGLDQAYARARAGTDGDWDAALSLRSSIQRLLDTNALGGYVVAVLAKGAQNDVVLRGLAPLGPAR